MANMNTGEIYSVEDMDKLKETFKETPLKETDRSFESFLTEQNIVEISEEQHDELKPMSREERIRLLRTHLTK